MVTSRTLPRVREVIELLKVHVKKVNRVGLVDYDYILVDFTDMVSILSAYYDLQKQYKAIHYLFINAAQGVYDGINWFQAVKDVMMNPLQAVTFPEYKVQRVGVKSADGIGLVFQANVFGPYYFIHKILPLLQEGNAIIVWISSIMSLPKYLSLNDIEMLQSDASYEGSKRLVDLVHLGTYKQMKELGIHQYVVHPGIFTSHSFFKFLNVFTYYGMLFLFYFARLLGSKWHNIDGYKAANAPVYVATLGNPQFDHQNVKFGSATSMDGMEYIERSDIDPTGTEDVMDYMKLKTKEWDEELKDQIVNTRVPI